MAFRLLPRPSGDATRRFAFEIATNTIGILIALWIDEVRETRRDARRFARRRCSSCKT